MFTLPSESSSAGLFFKIGAIGLAFGFKGEPDERFLSSSRDTEGSSRGESGGIGAKDGKERVPYEL